MIRSLTRLEARNRRLRMLLVLPAAAAAAAVVAACSSSSTPSSTPSSSSSGSSTSSPAAATAGTVTTATIGGATVLTNVKGFAVYSFAPDTMTKSNCNGACAAAWPPVKGPTTAGADLTGKLGTIKRPDGSTQATYNGHPLYTFIKDTGPGTDTGNGVDAFGGLWHALTASGSAAPASTPSGSSPQHHNAPPSHAAVTTPAAPPATAPAQTANPTPQNNGGDHDADNNGGPSDGDGNI
jgi:predicted lipoprotein with Yx(FWY)xxD motif